MTNIPYVAVLLIVVFLVFFVSALVRNKELKRVTNQDIIDAKIKQKEEAFANARENNLWASEEIENNVELDNKERLEQQAIKKIKIPKKKTVLKITMFALLFAFLSTFLNLYSLFGTVFSAYRYTDMTEEQIITMIYTIFISVTILINASFVLRQVRKKRQFSTIDTLSIMSAQALGVISGVLSIYALLFREGLTEKITFVSITLYDVEWMMLFSLFCLIVPIGLMLLFKEKNFFLKTV